MVTMTKYRCEDCAKPLTDDDLHFDVEGVPLCTVHYDYLIEETRERDEAEYRRALDELRIGFPDQGF